MEWLHGGFGDCLPFLKKEPAVRQDIRRWYPEARSVLVCGFAYGGPLPAVPGGACRSPLAEGDGRSFGRIARYAAHEDYHGALKLRMQSVLAWLRQERPGADGRIFVDSSPVLERLYGAAAGLGWIGRNRLLISEEIGSFFLVAGIALNADLPPDAAAPDGCGSCRLCLDACPPQALREGGLDAKRCTAFLTVEHRGAVPEALRPSLGCWVAGCDVCQEVCPWNSGARTTPSAGALRPLLPLSMPLEELALLDEKGFLERFGETPLRRLRRRRLARNAVLAMGNCADESFRPVLDRLAQAPDPELRAQALWSLARLPSLA